IFAQAAFGGSPQDTLAKTGPVGGVVCGGLSGSPCAQRQPVAERLLNGGSLQVLPDWKIWSRCDPSDAIFFLSGPPVVCCRLLLRPAGISRRGAAELDGDASVLLSRRTPDRLGRRADAHRVVARDKSGGGALAGGASRNRCLIWHGL